MKGSLQVIFILIFALLLLGVGHFVVYRSLIYIFNITNLRTIYTLRTVFIVGFLSFIIMTLITQIGYTLIGAFFYKISSIWLGIIYFLFLASVMFGIIFGFFQIFNLSLFILKILGMVLFIFALLISIYGVIHSFNIGITKYNVSIEGLPNEWNNKNIVMFADSHFGNIRNTNFGKRLVSKINEQNPEIVLIAGDYYDGPPVNYMEVGGLMNGIKTNKGIFFTSGNHEEYGKTANFINSLSSVGIKILNNKVINIDGFQLVGIDYLSGLNEDSVYNTLNNLDLKKDEPKILIKHAPTILPGIEGLGFDLVVSGHTHNGQVWPGPYITKKVFKGFSYGLNYINNMAVITTSGVGTWGPPQRVGTKSEIVVIRLNKK